MWVKSDPRYQRTVCIHDYCNVHACPLAGSLRGKKFIFLPVIAQPRCPTGVQTLVAVPSPPALPGVVVPPAAIPVLPLVPDPGSPPSSIPSLAALRDATAALPKLAAVPCVVMRPAAAV